MLGFLSKIFGGSKSEKDVKQIQPLVDKINQFFQQYQSLSNDELRNNTQLFRARIKAKLENIDAEIANQKNAAEALTADQLTEKDAIYRQIDELIKDRDKQTEEVLMEVPPEAFATNKEAARGFKE